MADNFRAIVTRETDDHKGISQLETISFDDLPEGEVLVKIHHAAMNYKDGLALGGLARIIREFPFVCGIDSTGEVVESSSAEYKPGDKVIINGWRIGEIHWGGFSEYQRFQSDWLVPLPEGLTLQDAATLGVAGLTAGVSLISLERHGVKPGDKPLLVTGASGGVGSFCVQMASRRGYDVTAVSGRPYNYDYLKSLGASNVIPRSTYNEGMKKPLSKEQWCGVIDNSGGPALAQILTEIQYGGALAAVGLPAGNMVEIDLITLFVRRVAILGIDTALVNRETRIAAFDMAVQTMKPDDYAAIRTEAKLEEVPDLGRAILKGQVKGRAVVTM